MCLAPDHSLTPFVAIVSDGAGSASYGGQGASLVCRTFARRARAYFSVSRLALPSDSEIEGWVDDTRDLIGAVAARRGVPTREFAATLVCVIAGPVELLVAHIGDGCAVIRTSSTDEWIAPSWPQQGEYASTTFFVTDENDVRLRITRVPARAIALAAFSDGIERLVLDMASSRPFGAFFDSVMRPVQEAEHGGRSADLSASLKRYLDSPAINARTDDDKTLVLAARK